MFRDLYEVAIYLLNRVRDSRGYKKTKSPPFGSPKAGSMEILLNPSCLHIPAPEKFALSAYNTLSGAFAA